MKKIILWIFLVFLCVYQGSYANFLSPQEEKKLESVKHQLHFISENKSENWFQQVDRNLSKVIPKLRSQPKMWYIVSQIQQELQKIYQENFPSIIEISPQEEENISNISDNSWKYDFFQKYGWNITTSLELSEKCREHYDFIDEIAQRNDFPTSLVIATWSKESNCNLFNPYNGWGPYQITSRYYTPGEITLADLEVYTQDFIDFSKGKWTSYHRNSNLKNRFWIENIEIRYDFFTLESLQLHAILYNGVGKTTTLSTNLFANTNLHGDIVGNSDGLVTRVLKVLHYETQK